MSRQYVLTADQSSCAMTSEKFKRLLRELSLTSHHAHSKFLNWFGFGDLIEKFGRHQGSETLKEEFDGKDDPDSARRGNVDEDGRQQKTSQRFYDGPHRSC